MSYVAYGSIIHPERSVAWVTGPLSKFWNPYTVLPRDAMSDTLVYCIHIAENIVKLLSRPGSHIIPLYLTFRMVPCLVTSTDL